MIVHIHNYMTDKETTKDVSTPEQFESLFGFEPEGDFKKAVEEACEERSNHHLDMWVETLADKIQKLAKSMQSDRGPLEHEIEYGFTDLKNWRLEKSDIVSKLQKLKKAEVENYPVERAYNDMTPEEKDHAYNMFKETYEKATGKAWDRTHFDKRARNWTFVGDKAGFIAYRRQQTGAKKICGAAGHIKSKHAAMKNIMESGSPVWTAATKELADGMAKHYGMMIAPADLVKQHAPLIAPAMGGKIQSVDDDGGINIIDHAVGVDPVKKYVVINQEAAKAFSGKTIL